MINYLRKLKTYFRQTEKILSELRQNIQDKKNDLKNPKVTTGRLLSNYNNQQDYYNNIQNAEFQVFSQWGDDGIIQYLINKLDIPHKTFVEFGVENYTESNTRFLLINNNWVGMVLDGDKSNIEFVQKDILSWAHELYAKHTFITKENINSLLAEIPFDKELGILSIDIDGNDYWVWKEINTVNPVIVIVEYNSVFGDSNPWTIPYQSDFVRPRDNYKMLLYGTSLTSICDLAEDKGYFFIGCNSAGNNAYFIRKDKVGFFKPLTPQEGYVLSRFREFMDNEGRVGGLKRYNSLKGQQVYNTRTNEIEIIS